MPQPQSVVVQKFTQDLSLGALSFTFIINAANIGFSNQDYGLQEVLIGFSVNVSETITVSYINAAGANYTIQLDSTTLSSNKNYVFRPTTPSIFKAGDSVKITCTNTGNTGVAYGVLKLQPIC